MNEQASHVEMVIAGFEGYCAQCDAPMKMEFKSSIIPWGIDEINESYWYEGTCENGHYVEVSCDADGCVTE